MRHNISVTSQESGALLAGLWQRGSTTIKDFYDMLQHVLIFDQELLGVGWALFDDYGHPLQADASIMPTGTHPVRSSDGAPCAVDVTPEKYRKRTRSKNDSENSLTMVSHCNDFKTRIRARDQRCLVSEQPVEENEFGFFAAAHIFPTAHQDSWARLGFTHQIQDVHPSIGASKINSIQNGMLLAADVAAAWDNYVFTIHPDVSWVLVNSMSILLNTVRTHRIVYFAGCTLRGVPDGKQVSFDHCAPEERPLDTLLREHWRQCVLARVKAAGAKSEDFEFYFGPGEVDLQNEARWGSGIGREMLEIELHRRLAIY
ncbi:hypothetical protein BOTBODRAFT_179941 [Botryobasidium botryosum FD-172 SS1]|uniref:HNH nuclease domain-containing protein n=1 Tax=Botryobasidium botryosum (strain FD-172 SS1) TaxID=930990 RepID=A0A067M906_BOTB1|nr:hypothetical protein BOTBODRAFT_179941 [Botryobasidium botryosum FD-172 SS1]